MCPYYAFDLDGTLAVDEGIYDRVGPPVPAMLHKIKALMSAGVEVRIITARLAPEWDEADAQRVLIEAWCEEHLGQRIPVQAHKTGGMLKLYDDRAIGIQHNTGIPLHELHLAIDRTIAAQKIENVFYERTGISMDPRVAEAIAKAILTPPKELK
jgi:hypothetical protein